MNILSAQTTKRMEDDVPYWRSEFERIYVIAAIRQRHGVTQDESVREKMRRDLVNSRHGELVVTRADAITVERL